MDKETALFLMFLTSATWVYIANHDEKWARIVSEIVIAGAWLYALGRYLE
jgi:hypothetical protein